MGFTLDLPADGEETFPRTFGERFGAAFDKEVQNWIDGAKQGELGGPDAWDGYATAACCEAGVTAQKSGANVNVILKAKPNIYL